MHQTPLVRDAKLIQHVLHWKERCHMDGNVDVGLFEVEKLGTMLEKRKSRFAS